VIILNSQRELVRVESWTDITERVSFSGNLDPSTHTLDSIIGRYAFGDKVPCGLSNCHTPHHKGYIVVTKDGRETNIGKDCGKTYFGVDFETLSNKFDRDITEKENREKLWAFYFRCDEVAAQVTAIRQGEHGADWVHKQLQALQDSRNVTTKAARRIMLMAKGRDARLTRDREATEEEVAQLEEAQGRRLPRPQYVTERIGELAGLDALYPENNLKAILIEDVSERLKAVNELAIDSVGYEQLRGWSRWIGGLDAVFERALQAVRSGRTLLTKENLSPLAEAAALNTDEREHFLKFLRQYPQM
jgi:hypothetical protein